MKNRKFLCVLLLLAMVLSLMGCSKVGDTLSLIRDHLMGDEPEQTDPFGDFDYSFMVDGSFPDGMYVIQDEDGNLILHQGGQTYPLVTGVGGSVVIIGTIPLDTQGEIPDPTPVQETVYTPQTTPAPTTGTLSAGDEQRYSLQLLDQRILELSNEYRTSLGLSPLEGSSYLASLAYNAHVLGTDGLVDPSQYAGKTFVSLHGDYGDSREEIDTFWGGEKYCAVIRYDADNIELLAQRMMEELKTDSEYLAAIQNPALQHLGVSCGTIPVTSMDLIIVYELLFGGE